MDDSALLSVPFAENVKEGQKVEWEAEVSRHMPISVEVNRDSLRELNRQLKEIDPSLQRAVAKDIKKAVRPTARNILSRIPTQPPIRGMGAGGRLGWSKPRVGVYASPSAGGKGSIARIEIFASNPERRGGFKMADLAGTKNKGLGIRRAHTRNLRSGRVVQVREHRTRSGDVMIDRLSRRYPLSAGGRGGRFGWENFMKERGFLLDKVLDIIDDYVEIVNRKGVR